MALNTSISLPTIDGVTLNRMLRRESVMRAVRVLKLVLLGACVIILFLILQALLTKLLTVSNSISEAQNQLELKISEANSLANSDKPKKNVNSDLLKGRGLFGEIGVAPVSANVNTVATPPPKATPLNLTLIGTFITGGAAPFAIIEHKKDGSQEPFAKGDKVFEEAELVAIFSDRVEIKRNGQTEILKLDDTPDSSDGATTAGSSAGSGELVVVAETELNQALDNLPLLLTQARAVPYFKDGQSVGLRLFAIKSGSLYEKIGLKNGDILKSINGSNLGDITQAVKLFERLREERSISLDIERNRQEQNIRYEIR